MASTIPTLPTMDPAALEGLTAATWGEVIQPGDPGYDAARKIYNAMIDKRPGLIVRCVDVADVIAVVNFARENNDTAGHSRRWTQRPRARAL